jgi:death-on-curing protein
MNGNPRFLLLDEVLFFHEQEMKRSASSLAIRDIKALEAALAGPKASFSGKYLMDIFEMAASYAFSICFNHPFLDGNKRTAALSAVSFLYLNGYEYREAYKEELADKILALVKKQIDKKDLASYFRRQSTAILL